MIMRIACIMLDTLVRVRKEMTAAHVKRFYFHMIFHIFARVFFPVAVSGTLREQTQEAADDVYGLADYYCIANDLS